MKTKTINYTIDYKKDIFASYSDLRALYNKCSLLINGETISLNIENEFPIFTVINKPRELELGIESNFGHYMMNTNTYIILHQFKDGSNYIVEYSDFGFICD